MLSPLTVNLAGLGPVTAIGLASCHLSGTEEGVRRAFEAGTGFVSLKTTTGQAARAPAATARIPEPADRRIALLREGKRVEGALNCETSYPHPFDRYLSQLLEPALDLGKSLLISVGYEVDEIRNTVLAIKGALGTSRHAIAFELSLHHAADPTIVRERIRTAVRAADPYPLYVKISYYRGAFLEISRLAVAECGAAGIVGINSLGPFDDIHGVLAPGEAGWLSGGLIAGISLEICRQVVGTVCDPHGVPYIAVGGVDSKNVAAFIRAGAMAVATCTYLMVHGVGRGVRQLTQGLQAAVSESGKPSLMELRGVVKIPNLDLEASIQTLPAAVKRLTREAPAVDSLRGPLTVSVETEKCRGCGHCSPADACSEGAFYLVEGNRTQAISAEKCALCGGCLSCCPFGAIDWNPFP